MKLNTMKKQKIHKCCLPRWRNKRAEAALFLKSSAFHTPCGSLPLFQEKASLFHL